MKRMAWLVVAAAAATACTVSAQAGGGDLAKLKGSWEVTSISFGGKKIDLPAGTKMMFTFDGEKVTFDDGKQKKEGTIKLDEGKKPRQFSISEGGQEKMKGIYEITGDTVKMAGGMGPNAPAPTGFDDDKAGIFELKRVKK